MSAAAGVRREAPRPRAAALAAGLACLQALLALASCSSGPRAAAVKPPPVDPVARAMAAGDYPAALRQLEAARMKDPGGRKLTVRYIAAVEEIRKSADGALAGRDFGRAAAAYQALLDGWTGIGGFASKLTFGRDDLRAGLAACRAGESALQARRALAARNYGQAVAAYRSALKDQPGNAELKAGFASVVGEIQAAGEKAFDDGDYAAAGRISVLLLDNLAGFERQGVAGKLTAKSLAAAVQRCAVRLKNRGLVEYRKGNLEKAVAIWDGLLEFDPGNAEIKRAVETARAQIGRLKTLAPGGKGGRG